MEIEPLETKWSNERVLDIVRQLRNDLIKDFLDERNLKSYVKSKYNVALLSQIQLEFIRKELKELLISPVDTNHYAGLIDQIVSTDSAALAECNEVLFYQDVERVIKRHIFS